MTRQISCLAILLLFSAPESVYSRTQEGPAFDLSEPDSGSTADRTTDNSVTTRPRPPLNAEKGSDNRPRTTGSAKIPRTVRRSQPEKPAEIPASELILEDASDRELFSGPVPRSKDIAEDSSLNDVCSAGNQCWAVGERGVVCGSMDGGQTWTMQLTPFECSLRSVCFLTNRVGWIAGLRIIPGASRPSAVLMHTRDGGRSWIDVSATTTAPVTGSSDMSTAELPGILHVQFFGLEEAVAVTLPVPGRERQGIFRTTDGGVTWSAIPTDREGGPWTAAHFFSDSEGIVVGKHQSYATVVSHQAAVISAPQPTLRQVRGVSVSQNGNGWIVGDGGFVMTTGNAGVTWQPPSGEFPVRISDIADLHTVAHRASTVLIAGNPGGSLLRSASAGSEWTMHRLPMTGLVNRLRFISDKAVLAVGSLGQILKSDDAGISWRSVRSATLRPGVMTLVTDADRAPWQLLASASGEIGVRSVIVQISQPLDDSGAAFSENSAAMSERTQLALTQLGGNDTIADWMFPRTKPEHHRASAQLIAEWNRQTDGRLQMLLPLRIARDIRNWRPSVIVIEPGSDDDAVAEIFRDVIAEAVRLAASPDTDAVSLTQVSLQPWTVQRVISRISADRTASLSFDDSDLLPSTGTTIGLLCDAAMTNFEHSTTVMNIVRPLAGYEVLSDIRDAAAVKGLFAGLEDVFKSDARRTYRPRSREDVDSLTDIVRSAHIESSALKGQLHLATTEDAVIAELRRVGANLPESLALKQLRDLAGLNLQHNNTESYLAVQQEITRRFPASADARQAAEMLFLFYSSAESRHYRLQLMQEENQQRPGAIEIPPVSALREQDISSSGDLVQPIVQSGTAQGFSSGAGNSIDALCARWDSHAATALKILSTRHSALPQPQVISPAVLLRHAANLRNQQRSGELNTVLSELGQHPDEYGLFALSEMQVVNLSSSPVLPLINLPRQTERPFLDGVLTDRIWEVAQEIRLTPIVQNTTAHESEESTRQSNRNASPVSSLTMLAWDEEFLYLAARLDRAPQRVRAVQPATHRGHDTRHEDLDRLELEIDTDRDFTTSFRLTVDESGRTSDRCWLLDKWNPEWFVAVDSDKDTWRIEAAIPLSELSAQPAKPGDLWSVRLRRVVPGVLLHEMQSGTKPVSGRGTALVRFIRPKARTQTRAR